MEQRRGRLGEISKSVRSQLGYSSLTVNAGGRISLPIAIPFVALRQPHGEADCWCDCKMASPKRWDANFWVGSLYQWKCLYTLAETTGGVTSVLLHAYLWCVGITYHIYLLDFWGKKKNRILQAKIITLYETNFEEYYCSIFCGWLSWWFKSVLLV